MIAKRLLYLLLLVLVLGTLMLSLPVNVKAQDNILCGYFQDNGYDYYNFYPYEKIQGIATGFTDENFQSTFGFSIHSSPVWIELTNTRLNQDGAITGFDSYKIVDSCAPTTSSTNTAIPPTETFIPPSVTPISPTLIPTSTLIIPPPATQNSVLELSVVPINQHLFPPITLSNGMKDYGAYDCFIASTSMALEYFKNQGVLNNDDTTNYRNLVPIVRGTTPPSNGLIQDPAFVGNVTNNKLAARAWYTTPGNLSVAIETELKKGNPVLVSVPNWNLLAAHRAGKLEHSIFVYGLHDGKIFYVDPWDGTYYSMPIQDLVNADAYQYGSFLITFKRSL
ncbi:MAG: C39 family peptidase [Anaerolineales bacterium]|nr:C39 family peptidase [Anaerolineales bacterium]